MPARSEGFILAVVLWMLVAIAVVVGLFVLWSRERVAEASALRAAVEARADMIGTRDTLLYIAATVPMTQGGLPVAPLSPTELSMRRLDEFGAFDKAPRGGELRLDGTLYRGLGEATVALQDEAGLVGLAVPETAPFPRLLAAAGVPAGERASLADAIADYVDADDLRRLNGAEARRYEREDLPPPANRPLLLPAELRRVFGWHALPPERFDWLAARTTTGYAGALNLNTAPIDLIEALVPECQRVCAERLSRRGDEPFLSGRDFEAEAAARLPGDRDIDFRVVPSEHLRMTLWGASGSAWRIHVRLTPLADGAAPWAVDAAYRVPRPADDDPPRPIPSPFFTAPPLAGP